MRRNAVPCADACRQEEEEVFGGLGIIVQDSKITHIMSGAESSSLLVVVTLLWQTRRTCGRCGAAKRGGDSGDRWRVKDHEGNLGMGGESTVAGGAGAC